VLTGAESSGALGMTVTEGPRGTGVAAHAHASTYEGIYVLDGRLRVTADGEEHVLTRGDFMSVPAGVSHELGCEAHLTRFVTMYGPAGPERLYELAGEVAEQRIFPETAAPVDEGRLEAAGAELDVSFAG
jgi:quercetin 2,3-dioxygenase